MSYRGRGRGGYARGGYNNYNNDYENQGGHNYRQRHQNYNQSNNRYENYQGPSTSAGPPIHRNPPAAPNRESLKENMLGYLCYGMVVKNIFRIMLIKMYKLCKTVF